MYKYPSNTKFNFTVFHIAITFVIASIVYLTGSNNNASSYAVDLISTNNTEDKVFEYRHHRHRHRHHFLQN